MSLELYVGPMYAGKTTKLLSMFKTSTESKKLIINYDIQSNAINKIRLHKLETHDKDVNLTELEVYHVCSLECFYTTINYSYNRLQNIFHKSNEIYINECQFFPNLKHYVLKMLSDNKKVYLYGLDGDYKQELFGQTLELVPYCSKIEKLNGKCQWCQKRSILTHRTSSHSEQYLPNDEFYVPLCFSCYKNTENNKVV
jgi:thymidine kinase